MENSCFHSYSVALYLNTTRQSSSWPSLDKSIKELCKTCQACQQFLCGHKTLAKSPYRLAWPFQGHMYLSLIDAHSKQPEIVCISLCYVLKLLKSLIVFSLLSFYLIN